MKKMYILLSLFIVGMFAVGCANQKSSSGEGDTTKETNASESNTVNASEANEEEPGKEKEASVTSNQAEDEEHYRIVLTTTVKNVATDVAFANDKQGFTVGPSGAMFFTVDGGTTWEKAENKSACQYGCTVVDEKVCYSTGNGETRVSFDGGKSWDGVEFYGKAVPDQNRYLSFIDKNIGWIASIYKFGATKDGGKTWTEVALPEELGEGKNKIAAIHLSNEKTGYLLDEKGNLYITSDSGASWDKKILDISSLNLKNGVISTSGSPHAAIKFYSESNGIIAFSSISDGAGKTWIAWTLDGGNTWTLETLDFGDRYQLTLLHITKDGKYLTISDTKDTNVLELNYE